MIKENVVLVDINDNKLGLMEKLEAHRKGLLHRAFSVFILDEKKRLLLQKRALNKYHSPGLWTNTCCSHPRDNEDVIDDLNGQVRRMLDYLELPFEEQCISFHETDRSVRTASSEQVRQPINKKGMGRWKPYAKHLKPLLNNLDNELLAPEDIALIN